MLQYTGMWLIFTRAGARERIFLPPSTFVYRLELTLPVTVVFKDRKKSK